MKTLFKKCVLVTAALIIALGSATAISGCKKKEASPLQKTAEPTKQEAAKTAEQAKKDATKTAEQTKKTVEKAVEPNK